MSRDCDVAIVGAGAAGLATAIFARRLNPHQRIVLLDGARKPGAKILVSGGGRCNVTNAQVTEDDFNGGSRATIRRVLRALPVAETVAFFAGIGVALHEEPGGKLFPDSQRARDVLDALTRELERCGVAIEADHRVTAVARHDGRFLIDTTSGTIIATRVVLATGGQSLPKSGSDGSGFALAARLGHTIVPPVPALVPLRLADAPAAIHPRLSGVSHDAELTVWVDGRVLRRVRGSLLWTHFGISGPVTLDASRHWTRASSEGRDVRLTLSFCPGREFDALDAELLDTLGARPRTSVQSLLTLVPASVIAAILDSLAIPPTTPGGSVTRADRRRLLHALLEWPLEVTGTRGYNFAEATAGGIALREVDPATLESRVCPNLYLVGEVLDVDGRIGGFNFQWAWSSGRTAAAALARSVASGSAT